MMWTWCFILLLEIWSSIDGMCTPSMEQSQRRRDRESIFLDNLSGQPDWFLECHMLNMTLVSAFNNHWLFFLTLAGVPPLVDILVYCFYNNKSFALGRKNIICIWPYSIFVSISKNKLQMQFLKNVTRPNLKSCTDLPAFHHRWAWRAAAPRDWTPPTSALQRPKRRTWWRSRPRTRTRTGASAEGSTPAGSGNTR